MNDDKIYTPEVVPENPFPGEIAPVTSPTSSPSGVYTPKTESEKKFPIKKVATELISTALNTKSKKILQAFEFTPSGSIQIGQFEDGVSGDIRITPNGITARDLAGLITFVLDGTSGDATFRGTIQTGALIAGLVAVGDNSIVIDGEGDRITMTDNDGFVRILIGEDG